MGKAVEQLLNYIVSLEIKNRIFDFQIFQEGQKIE